MEEALKKRLIGAVTLVALAVIFVPPLLDQRVAEPVVDVPDVPPIPNELQPDFSSQLINTPITPPEVPEHILSPPIEPELQANLTPTPEPVPQQEQTTVVAETQTLVEEPSVQPLPTVNAPQTEPVAHNLSLQDTQPVGAEKSASTQPNIDQNLQAWVVQVASFSQPENAQKLVKRLRGAGYQVPDLVPVQIKDKAYYRVKVGPMLQKSAAENLLPKINALSGSKGRVVLHRP